MVGCPERTGRDHGLASREQPGHGPDMRDLQRLLNREGREDARQAPGEHGLAGARRPDHEEVVAPRRRDLQRAAGERLAPDLREVRPLCRRLGEELADERRGGQGIERSLHDGQRLGEARGARHRDAGHERRLGGVGLR